MKIIQTEVGNQLDITRTGGEEIGEQNYYDFYSDIAQKMWNEPVTQKTIGNKVYTLTNVVSSGETDKSLGTAFGELRCFEIK